MSRPERAHDSRRYRSFQAEWRPDSNRPIAYLHGVRIADIHRNQRASGIDLNHRQIRFRIDADHARAIFRAVVAMQLHFDVIHFGDHMMVGDDVSVLVHHEAGSGLFLLEGSLRQFLA